MCHNSSAYHIYVMGVEFGYSHFILGENIIWALWKWALKIKGSFSLVTSSLTTAYEPNHNDSLSTKS